MKYGTYPTISKKNDYFWECLVRKGRIFSVLSKMKYDLPDHCKVQFELKIRCTTTSVP